MKTVIGHKIGIFIWQQHKKQYVWKKQTPNNKRALTPQPSEYTHISTACVYLMYTYNLLQQEFLPNLKWPGFPAEVENFCRWWFLKKKNADNKKIFHQSSPHPRWNPIVWTWFSIVSSVLWHHWCGWTIRFMNSQLNSSLEQTFEIYWSKAVITRTSWIHQHPEHVARSVFSFGQSCQPLTCRRGTKIGESRGKTRKRTKTTSITITKLIIHF